MVGSLAAQVRELSLRVADLEGQIAAARKRIAVYEDFDSQVQDSLAAALRAAGEIRARAQVSAEAMAEEARAKRTADTGALDALRLERDALRRVIETASKTPRPRAAAAPSPVVFPAVVFPASEMRTAAADALRGVFKELVAELRAVAPAPAPPAAPTPPPIAAYVPPPAVAYQPPPQAVPPPQQVAPPPPQAAPPPPQAAPPPPLSAVPPPAREELVGSAEPMSEVQVVLSPVPSFPRLVELERRLQALPIVRTVYARDFRNGIATLAVGLRTPMTVDEFAAAVSRLEYPRVQTVSTVGQVLELRIVSEASSIA